MAEMTVRLDVVVVDATAPNELAQFWARALRWDVGTADGVGAELVPTDATSFRVVFRPVTRAKVGQNRIHFDLTTSTIDDQNDTVADLLAIGARHVDIGQDDSENHVVLADPEGNEFCVLAPGNRFLAGCPRLGAVNCDGTHALGCFWSDALGWPLVWDHEEETAIQSPDATGPKITWSGPPLMPRSGKERLHFHVAPISGTSAQAASEHLLRLGATRPDAVHDCPGATSFADVDGNEFCLIES